MSASLIERLWSDLKSKGLVSGNPEMDQTTLIREKALEQYQRLFDEETAKSALEQLAETADAMSSSGTPGMSFDLV